MNSQVNLIFKSILPFEPSYIKPLLAAYRSTNPPVTDLNFNLFAEPYYGNFNKCSFVLLTHNPGNSDRFHKGIGSAFEKKIQSPLKSIEDNYFTMATTGFPNPATNRWIKGKNLELQNHFDGIQKFNDQAFIRDLIPYHSSRFGEINMTICINYLYNYFFNQVINSSYNSELHNRINSKKELENTATIIYARGSAWKSTKFGLESIGWKRVGNFYSYYTIFKADFNEVQKISDIDLTKYPKNILSSDIYIVVLTQVREGAKLGIYRDNKSPRTIITLAQAISNYETINDVSDRFYIKHNTEMDKFIKIIK